MESRKYESFELEAFPFTFIFSLAAASATNNIYISVISKLKKGQYREGNKYMHVCVIHLFDLAYKCLTLVFFFLTMGFLK